MKNRRKKLDKNLVISLFLEAFDKAGIERENTTLKTPKPYKILAQKIIVENDLDPVEFSNYDRYIKDRFNTAKRLLKDHSKSNISFNSLQFDPLKAYAYGTAAAKPLGKVLFRMKPYGYFNFWRMPKQATILLKSQRLVLQKTDGHEISLGVALAMSSYIMPRDKKAYWIKLSLQNGDSGNQIFLTPLLINNQPSSYKLLQERLKKHIENRNLGIPSLQS